MSVIAVAMLLKTKSKSRQPNRRIRIQNKIHPEIERSRERAKKWFQRIQEIERKQRRRDRE